MSILLNSIIIKKPLSALIEGLKPENTIHINLSATNKELRLLDLKNTEVFTKYIEEYLSRNKADYAIGGYNENREIYQRSNHFDTAEESRCIHLGIDVWTKEWTPVFSPLNGTIHSLKDNNNFGDYGPTIIIQHEIDGQKFHLLYGHLSQSSLNLNNKGDKVEAGALVGYIGPYPENGDWPPHLHFQMILDMQGHTGDYPGVCKKLEATAYLKNCIDPSIFLMV
ncbi:MAG: peptidoglycan DD-metalloendopeptidase family protein [Bacteroidetes bacterium]|nr:peptidoglycan DD-metalloendopeptidase family protein [Bacteroidota bacterium]